MAGLRLHVSNTSRDKLFYILTSKQTLAVKSCNYDSDKNRFIYVIKMLNWDVPGFAGVE